MNITGSANPQGNDFAMVPEGHDGIARVSIPASTAPISQSWAVEIALPTIQLQLPGVPGG